MQKTAYLLIKEYGAPVVFKRNVGEITNPVNGQIVTEGESQEISVNAVVVPIKESLIDGTRIKIGDKRMICSSIDINGNNFSPLISDILDDWKIQEIEPISPATTPIVYFCRVRK